MPGSVYTFRLDSQVGEKRKRWRDLVEPRPVDRTLQFSLKTNPELAIPMGEGRPTVRLRETHESSIQLVGLVRDEDMDRRLMAAYMSAEPCARFRLFADGKPVATQEGHVMQVDTVRPQEGGLPYLAKIRLDQLRPGFNLDALRRWADA
jgi:hypothetical protein